MWDDVIIGTGSKGNSATRVFEIEGNKNISENSVSYWIGECYLGLGMTIFKSTDEGMRLSQLINERASLETIQGYLDGCLLTNLSKDKLKEAITKALKQAFNDGRNSKAEQMRQVLGLE